MEPTQFSAFLAIFGLYFSLSSIFYMKSNLISLVSSLRGSKKNKTKVFIISSLSYLSYLPFCSASSIPLPYNMSCRSILVLALKALHILSSLQSKHSSKEIPVILLLFSNFLLICLPNSYTLVYSHVPIWLLDFNNKKIQLESLLMEDDHPNNCNYVDLYRYM
jgi:hypothetical protein